MATADVALKGILAGEVWEVRRRNHDGRWVRFSKNDFRQYLSLAGWCLLSDTWRRVPEPRTFLEAVDRMSADVPQRCLTSGRVWSRYGDALIVTKHGLGECGRLRVDEINATDWEDA